MHLLISDVDLSSRSIDSTQSSRKDRLDLVSDLFMLVVVSQEDYHFTYFGLISESNIWHCAPASVE